MAFNLWLRGLLSSLQVLSIGSTGSRGKGKQRKGKALGLLVFPLFLSCHFNEKPAPLPSPVIRVEMDSKCLRNLLPTLKDFWIGTAEELEIDQVWNCLGIATQTFKKKVVGVQHNAYSSGELRQFFQDFFLDESTQISDSLLREIMEFKRLFVGGSTETLTAAELDRITELAERGRILSQNLRPYMGIFSQNTPAPISDFKFFERGMEVLHQAVSQMAILVEPQIQTYEIKRFPLLLKELSELYHEDWPFVSSAERGLPIVGKLKLIFTGGSPDLIEPGEWKKFGLLLSRSYSQYLRYRYFLKSPPAPQPPAPELLAASESELQVSSAALDPSVPSPLPPQGPSQSPPREIIVHRVLEDFLSFAQETISQKPGGKLTRTELLDLSETLNSVFPLVHLQAPFWDGAMKIKRVLFGGSQEEWIPEELNRFLSQTDLLERLLDKLSKYRDLYTFRWSGPYTSSFFDQGAQALGDVAQSLEPYLEAEYDMEDFIVFLRECRKTFSLTWVDSLERFYPLILQIKKTLMGETNSLILKQRWSDFLNYFTQTYTETLYYYYYLRNQSLTKGQGLDSFYQWGFRISEILRKTLEDRKALKGSPQMSRFEISLSEWDATIDELYKKGVEVLSDSFIPNRILKKIYRIAFRSWLVPFRLRFQGYYSQGGLGIPQVEEFQEEFRDWYTHQKWIDALFPKEPRGAPSLVLDSNTILTSIQNSESRGQLLEMEELFKNGPITRLFPLGDQGHWLLDLTVSPSSTKATSQSISPTQTSKMDRKGLEIMNLARQFMHILIRSFSEDPIRASMTLGPGLLVNEVDRAYLEDLFDLLYNLNIVDHSEIQFARNRFMEGNLFTFQGNGDDYLNFREGVDLIQMVYSGLQVSGDIETRLLQSCEIQRADKRYDYQVVDVACLEKVYREGWATFFPHLPRMNQYVAAFSPEKFHKFLGHLLEASGYLGGVSGKRPKFSSISRMPHLIQYIESIMLRFDSDGNGELSSEETLRAFPVFKSIISSIARNQGLTSEFYYLPLFTYLVRYGSPPQTSLEKLRFVTTWSQTYLGDWNIHAHRENLAQILRFLGKVREAN